MTREELHALVWSQPVRTVAKSMGISDVALAKQCRGANVPIPPRGWWARKAAGRAGDPTPLPPLPFVMASFFPAYASGGRPVAGETPPAFRDFAEVELQIRAAVRAVKAPLNLERPHPIVARLLKQDAERKSKQSTSGYISDYYGPKFATPIQQRRLKILSSIFLELQRLGCKIHGATHAGERFNINVGGHWTYVLFGVEGGRSSSHFPGRYVRADREGLRFDLVDHDDRVAPARTWRETDTPLEKQATEIVCGILLRVEEGARTGALFWHDFQIKERARQAREAKLAAEKAEAERIAREKADAAARLQSLIDGADALECAARIRRYVAAVCAQSGDSDTSLAPEVVERWKLWALAEADRVDPVRSGRFLTGLEGLGDRGGDLGPGRDAM